MVKMTKDEHKDMEEKVKEYLASNNIRGWKYRGSKQHKSYTIVDLYRDISSADPHCEICS